MLLVHVCMPGWWRYHAIDACVCGGDGGDIMLLMHVCMWGWWRYRMVGTCERASVSAQGYSLLIRTLV